MNYKINYPNIPVLAIGFSRSNSLFAKAIQLIRKILNDKGAPNHAFVVTEDHGQLFATEETLNGLVENSLEEYTSDKNRIVAMYTFKGFDNLSHREDAQRHLATIRRKAGENSKYDIKGVLSFIPGFNHIFKPDPRKQWCSENVASLLNTFGAGLGDTTIAPDTLLKKIQDKKSFKAVLGYYV